MGLCSIKCLWCCALFEVKAENMQWQAWVLFDWPCKPHTSKDNRTILKLTFLECFLAALETQPWQPCTGIGETKNVVEWSSSLSKLSEILKFNLRGEGKLSFWNPLTCSFSNTDKGNLQVFYFENVRFKKSWQEGRSGETIPFPIPCIRNKNI